MGVAKTALCPINPRSRLPAPPRPVGMKIRAARLVGALVLVGTKEIALGLQQVGGQVFAAVTVVIRQCGRHGGHGGAVLEGLHQRVFDASVDALD